MKRKRLELSTPNLVDIECMAVVDVRVPWSQKVKGQDYGVIIALPAWVCMSTVFGRPYYRSSLWYSVSSVVVCLSSSVTFCIVAKRCVLAQKCLKE